MPIQPILRLALPTPLRRLFDYLPPQGVDCTHLVPGVRVKVPFQARTLVGILVEVAKESSVPVQKLKQALEVLDEESIFLPDVYKLCEWAADYYHYALGEVFTSALPVLLRKGTMLKRKEEAAGRGDLFSGRSAHGCADRSQDAALPENKSPLPAASSAEVLQCHKSLTLNPQQQFAITQITSSLNTYKTFLLDGVTGSGKTEVYLRVIEKVLALDKQVLVLVPEISLTPQTIARFQERFTVSVLALHSGLSEKERLQAWIAGRAGDAKIIIGTRSAIFTPLANMGLIIVDEEHDNSFKQQDRFRYHARDLAIMRASLTKVPVVLGSATPSLESLLNAQRNRYEFLSLPHRAGEAQLPTYEMIDLKIIAQEEGISTVLMRTMREHLEKNNQVMLFLNKRGFAPVLYCTQCAWVAECKRCDTRMVCHRSPVRLQCHHCDSRSKIPTHCPGCKEAALQPIGLGTQRLEETLTQHFPDVSIIRVDRDTTRRKGAMKALLQQIHDEPKAILLGTQMLAKGHHFPNVTLVGIVDADSGLFSADFRAAEQMGQLLLQVGGRAGRAEKPGTVLIQTRHPDHPLLQTLIQQGYPCFSEILLKEREQAILPPYSYFAIFRAEAHAESKATDFLSNIRELHTTTGVTILGPVPAILAKRKGLHCQHLLIKSTCRRSLQNHLQGVLQKLEALKVRSTVKWILDVDPIEV